MQLRTLDWKGVALFPNTRREEYRNNPIEEVICQFRFPPILKIGTTTPAEFQDSVRKQFPLYQLQDTFPPVPEQVREMLSQVGGGIENLLGSQFPRVHQFATEDGASVISLQSDFIALRVTDYKRWEVFRECLESIERSFRTIYEPQFYSRVGLRYRDVIVREDLGLDNAPWNELLNRDLVGFYGQDEASELVTQAVAAVQMKLPDIENAQVTLQYGLQTQTEKTQSLYFIDTDIAIEQRTGLDDAFSLLDQFNRAAGNIFRWAISDTLRNAMGPDPL